FHISARLTEAQNRRIREIGSSGFRPPGSRCCEPVRWVTNERSEFLMTTLPVVDVSAPVTTGTVVISVFRRCRHRRRKTLRVRHPLRHRIHTADRRSLPERRSEEVIADSSQLSLPNSRGTPVAPQIQVVLNLVRRTEATHPGPLAHIASPPSHLVVL